MFKRFVCLFLLMGIFSFIPVRAQFFIEEGKVELSVSGGERVNKTLIIHNTTDEPLDVKAYWEDFKYQPPYDGLKLFASPGTIGASANKWFSFTPQRFRLPAFGKQEIRYTVDVPSGMTGGYYGALFFEKDSDPIRDASGVNIITRLGTLFFIESNTRDKSSEITEMTVAGDKLKAVFVSRANVVLIPKTTYYFMDNNGMVLDRAELAKKYLPPGASADIEIPFPKGFNTEGGSLVINADLGDGDLVVKEVEFVPDSSSGLMIKHVRD